MRCGPMNFKWNWNHIHFSWSISLHHAPLSAIHNNQKTNKWLSWHMIVSVLLPQIICQLVHKWLVTVMKTFCVRNDIQKFIWTNQPQLLDAGMLILHDNTRLHITQTIRTVFTNFKWEALCHYAERTAE